MRDHLKAVKAKFSDTVLIQSGQAAAVVVVVIVQLLQQFKFTIYHSLQSNIPETIRRFEK